MPNVVIPLAGKDPRFDHYGVPKPLIKVAGIPLIKRCTDSLSYPFEEPMNLIFIILEEDQEKFRLGDRLVALYERFSPKLVFVEKVTEGAACTVLLARDLIDNDEELVIYFADIYFEGDLKSCLSRGAPDVKGVIATFKSSSEKYSYARLGDDGYVREVAEKKVISDNASAAFYYFAEGRDFVYAAEQMIRRDLRVNNWFYVCPVYNELIERGDKVRICETIFKFGLGSPEEIEKFKASNPS